MRSLPRRTVAALVAGVLASFVVATPAFATVPVAGNTTVRVSTSQAIPIDLSQYVTPGFSGTYSILVGPTTGSLSTPDTGGHTTFTPAGAAQGGDSDTFQYQFDDGTDPTSTGTITLDYNHPPTANGFSQDVSPTTPTTVDLATHSSDADGDTLTYTITSPSPLPSSLSQSGSQVTLTPPAGASGAVTFSYTVGDGVDTTSAATVTLTYQVVITGAPTPPRISPAHSSTISLGSFTKGGNGGTLTYSVVTPGAKGVVTFGNNGTATYNPVNGNPTGQDTFSYQVSDGHSTSAPSTVTVNFNGVPAATTFYSVSAPLKIAAARQTTINLGSYASDPDNDHLGYSVANQPTDATVTFPGHNASAVITPNPNATGEDAFTYKVSDSTDSATASAYVIYNKIPAASDDTITVTHGQSVTVNLNSLASDGDADRLSFPRVTVPQHGTITPGNGAQVTYTADGNYAGADFVQYYAFDGYDGSPTKTLTFNITDARPAAQAEAVQTGYDASKSFTVHGTDADDTAASLTYNLYRNAANGRVTPGANGSWVYTPYAGFAGTDSFWFTTTDPDGKTSTAAKVTVTVAKAPTKITSVVFSPKRPALGDDVSATINLHTLGSPVAGTVVISDGTRNYRGTMFGSSGTIYLHHLAAGTHHFKITYHGTATTAPTKTTATLTVPKATPKLTLSTKPSRLITTKHGVAKVSVTALNASVNGALVTIKQSHKTLGKAVVRSGVAKITLPKLSAGKHTLTVHYAGTASAASATKKWTVRVSRG